MNPLMQLPSVIAAADLGDRAGARAFEIGFLNDDTDPAYLEVGPQWWAHVQYRGRRIIVEGHDSPGEAADALAVRLLTGAKCRCGRLVAMSPDGAVAHAETLMADGSTWTAQEAAAAGQCLWTRTESRWNPGCAAPPVRVEGGRW